MMAKYSFGSYRESRTGPRETAFAVVQITGHSQRA